MVVLKSMSFVDLCIPNVSAVETSILSDLKLPPTLCSCFIFAVGIETVINLLISCDMLFILLQKIFARIDGCK